MWLQLKSIGIQGNYESMKKLECLLSKLLEDMYFYKIIFTLTSSYMYDDFVTEVDLNMAIFFMKR